MHTVATNNAAPVIAAGPVGPSRRRRRVHAPLTRRRQPSSSAVLLVAAFGAFLAFLDSTIVNVAFPDIQRHFHSDISDLSWMLNAYNIVFAAFLVAAGRLADLMGRKRVFILGVALFTVASGLCAIAESVGELVAFRVLQGMAQRFWYRLRWGWSSRPSRPSGARTGSTCGVRRGPSPRASARRSVAPSSRRMAGGGCSW